jgi:hypothetical protein
MTAQHHDHAAHGAPPDAAPHPHGTDHGVADPTAGRQIPSLARHEDAHELPFDVHGESVAVPAAPAEHVGLLIGTPDLDKAYYQVQSTTFTCVPMTEISIVNEYTGAHLTEAEATYEAAQHGWLTRDGTLPHHVGEILTLFGIENHRATHAEFGDIVAELSLGHKVIVGVNAQALHDAGHPIHAFAQQADTHAVWVTGLDATDMNHMRVILNDSADPNGPGVSYDLATFLDAWHTTGFEYVATDRAPPHLADRAHGFDEHTGRFEALTEAIRAQRPDFLVAEGFAGAPAPAGIDASPAHVSDHAMHAELLKKV